MLSIGILAGGQSQSWWLELQLQDCYQSGFRAANLDEKRSLDFEQKNDMVRFALKKKITQAVVLNMAGRGSNLGDRIQGRTKRDSSKEAGKQGWRE